MSRRAETALKRLRAICLGLPGVTEKEAWNTTTFRLADKKMFAMFANDHHGSGQVAVWLKAALGAQELLVESDPARFFVPPYVGPGGWVGVDLGAGVDWDEVADLMGEALALVAPQPRAKTTSAKSPRPGAGRAPSARGPRPLTTKASRPRSRARPS